MKPLLLSVAAIALIAGCNRETPEDVVDATGEVVTEVARDRSAPKPRAGDPAKAEDALASLFLKESGQGRVEFDKRDVKGATATFNNVQIELDEAAIEDALRSSLEDAIENGTAEVDVDTVSPIKIETMTFDGLDVTDAGQGVFSAMTLKNVSLVDEDGEDAGNRVDIGSFEIINPSPETAAWVSSLMGKGEPAPFPSVEKLSFDRLNLSNLNIIGNDEDGDANVSIKSLSIDEVGELLTGRVAMNDFKVDFFSAEDDVSGTFSIGSIVSEGVKMDVAKVISENADDEEALAEALMQTVYGNSMDPGFDKFVLDDMKLDVAGFKMDMPTMAMNVKRDGDKVPTRVGLDEFKMTFSANAEGGEAGAQIAPYLMMMGFDEIEMTAKSVTNYDPKTDIATSPDGYFQVKDAFKISSKSKVGGYKAYSEALANLDFAELAEAQGDPMEVQGAMMDAYGALSIYDMEFTIKDTGLVDKVLTILSAQTGQDPDALRQQAVFYLTMGSAGASGAGIDPTLVQESVGALTAFINDPDELTIALKPSAPIRITDFSGPEDVTKEKLGFSAIAK